MAIDFFDKLKEEYALKGTLSWARPRIVRNRVCAPGNRKTVYAPEQTEFRYRKYAGRSSRVSAELIRLAEEQNDPYTILDLVDSDRGNIHNAVLALKRMGRASLLSGFLFMGDEALANLVRKVMENETIPS